MLIEIGWSYRPVVKLAFADALKQEIIRATGVTLSDIETHKELFRPLLQVWGTEFRRKWNGDDYWISKVRLATDSAPDNALVVVTDVRYPNEVDFIRKRGGYLVQVVRPECKPTDTHVSETSMGHEVPNYQVDNSGSLHQLRENVTTLWRWLRAQEADGTPAPSLGQLELV